MTRQDTATPSSSEKPLKRDECFFFEGRYVTFLVKTTLFRVPQHPFVRASPFFRDIFALAQDKGEALGLSDATPIRLDGIKVSEFRSLLKLLTPSGVPPNKPTSIEDWESIFHLALMWGMQSIRKRAHSMLDRILADEDANLGVQFVLLGRRFGDAGWLAKGYDALVRRDRPLSEDEARKIGFRETVKVFQIRERLRGMICKYCELDGGCDECKEKREGARKSPIDEVQMAFEEELYRNSVQWAASRFYK